MLARILMLTLMATSSIALAAAIALMPRWLKNWKRNRASDWPVTEGHVEKVQNSWDTETGGVTVTLAYSYKVEGQWYSGHESFQFGEAEAASFEARYRNQPVLVNYRRNKPQVSLISRQSIPT